MLIGLAGGVYWGVELRALVPREESGEISDLIPSGEASGRGSREPLRLGGLIPVAAARTDLGELVRVEVLALG